MHLNVVITLSINISHLTIDKYGNTMNNTHFCKLSIESIHQYHSYLSFNARYHNYTNYAFKSQFRWVNKGALRGSTTCSDLVGIMDWSCIVHETQDLDDFRIKVLNKGNMHIFKELPEQILSGIMLQCNYFPVCLHMSVGIAINGHSFNH